jgi:hypothetical protein
MASPRSGQHVPAVPLDWAPRQHHISMERCPGWLDGRDVLHFSAEPCFVKGYLRRARRYVMADYSPGPEEVQADLQALPFEDASHSHCP